MSPHCSYGNGDKREKSMTNRNQHQKRKSTKKIRSRSIAKDRFAAPQTADEYFSQSEHFRDRWTRVTHVISKMGKYWLAVERYRDTGDASALRDFRGKHVIDATGKRTRLLTSLGALNHLGAAGVLSFESLYARAA